MSRHTLARRWGGTVLFAALFACAEQVNQPRATPQLAVQQLTIAPGVPTLLLGHTSPTGLPAEEGGDLGTLAVTTFVRFARSPAEGGGFIEMPVGGTAYFRDVAFAAEAVLEAEADGEFWDAEIVTPGGFPVVFPTITFHSEFGGEQDCFVSGFTSLCGGTVVFVSYFLGIQCQGGGGYTVHLRENGAQVFEGSFTLKPTLPPGTWTDHLQSDFPDAPYNTLCVNPNDSEKSVACTGAEGETPRTISEKGCALSSGAMLLSYFGIPTDPEALNDDLVALGDRGYVNGGVNWLGLLDLAAQQAETLGVRINTTATPQDLRNRICRFGPQIVEVKNRQHFVMVTGLTDDESDFLIADPNNPSGGGRLNSDYGGFKSVREFEPRSQPGFEEVILATVHSPAELVMTDPLGRRLGFDPVRGQAHSEIPDGVYATAGLGIDFPDGTIIDEEPWKELAVYLPLDGEYAVSVTGTSTGRYTLHLLGYDRMHRSAGFAARDIPIASGEVHRYAFAYSAADLSGGSLGLAGGFDGGGQRASVDALLSYARPAQRQTSLAAGTTAYSLLLFYGAAIDPGTFQAELNGASLTALFTPTPGGSEMVTIPLQPGRNVLILSVVGNPEGRAATDRDRLTFIVP